EILSKIAFEQEDKIIIDPMKRQGRIDVSIVNLPWKKALEVILKAHRLSFVEHEKFYEVSGELGQTETAKKEVTLSSREVRIEAIFFEGDRRALAEAGIDWSVLTSSSSLAGSFSVAGGTAVTSEIAEGSLSYSKILGGTDFSIDGMLRAFESENLGKILAQPEIVVLSGKTGRIQVGEDFSIKTRDFAGNIIDNFFSTGTILIVTPTVFEEEGLFFIHLNIQAERSSAQPDAVSTIIKKSQANTECILLNGESTALGGLFTRDFQTVRKGVPFLKDLPWWFLGLRYVFGYNLKDVTDKELLVVLRASLLTELKNRSTTTFRTFQETFEENHEKIKQKLENNWQKDQDNQKTK
ncbi:MAG: type II and III secretion system protein, partial [bacterium]